MRPEMTLWCDSRRARDVLPGGGGQLAWSPLRKVVRRKTMKRLIGIMVSGAALLVLAGGVHAQDLLVPAGTLLQCTLNEPNFSSATAAVGDPVLCHLRGLEEFGRPAFPRGSMLGGHLEAAKEPGHFWGKGYLKITFDRVILPSGDMPVPAKLIATKGYKVDKQGDIDGKGHAKRDVVEWMLPPLWPWKVLMLPARGPRPTLKGEEPMQLRLMDDIVIPRTLAYGPMKPDRPPYASSTRPSALSGSRAAVVQPAVEKRAGRVETAPAAAAGGEGTVRLTTLVLKSNEIYEVSKYRIDGDVVLFQQLNGTKGAIDVNQVDWRKTTQMASGVQSVDVAAMGRQTN